ARVSGGAWGAGSGRGVRASGGACSSRAAHRNDRVSGSEIARTSWARSAPAGAPRATGPTWLLSVHAAAKPRPRQLAASARNAGGFIGAGFYGRSFPGQWHSEARGILTQLRFVSRSKFMAFGIVVSLE